MYELYMFIAEHRTGGRSYIKTIETVQVFLNKQK
jgi:hypothetical protein